MYESFFGLKEKPFSLTPNPRFLYLSKTHNEVYAHLLYGVERRSGFIMVTGEVGTGKTTILRTLLNHLDEQVYRVAFIFNPKLTATDLLRNIAREFGIETPAEALPDLIEDLNKFLLAENRAGRIPVLVIDEAQNLSGDVLEQIRLLSNLETEADKLIQIILVGQPELETMLHDASLRQLNQRIAIRYRLLPLGPEESKAYVLHRLKIAGRPDGNLFSAKALNRIYRATGGVPRLINLICDRSLLAAYSDERGVVAPADIQQARQELAGEYVRPGSREGARRRRLAWAGAALFILAAGGLFAWLQRDLNPLPAAPAPAPRAEVEQTEPARALPEPQPAVSTAAAEAPAAQEMPDVPPGVIACRALLGAWGVPAAGDERIAATTFDPEIMLEQHDLQVMKLRGTIDELQVLNLPFYIYRSEVGLMGGHAVLGRNQAGWLVQPAWEGAVQVPLTTLNDLGSIDALVPWKDFAAIGYVTVPGQVGEKVRRLQLLLGMTGLDVAVSGRYDQATIRAVRNFQRARGLVADGLVGPRTLSSLYQASASYPVPVLRAADGGEG